MQALLETTNPTRLGRPEAVSQTATRPWWREKSIWLLLVLVAAIYSIRVTDLSVRGEESRRGRIAWEFLHSGDWIVPRLQGEPVFYRPPLQNWLIALVGLWHGEVDSFALRVPSIAAILLMVVIICGYGRSFLSRFGAYASALCYASLGQVIELGRLGETDSLFTLFLAGSLLTWKWCRNAGAPHWQMWCTSYALAALATLTKGPQAPLYFVGSVTLYCAVTGRFRELFTWSHLLGALTGLLVVGLWQVPYTLEMGFRQSVAIYFNDVGPRFGDLRITTIIGHLLAYPVELLAGSLLPWSVWLVCLLDRRFRQHLGRWRDDVIYLLTCVAITFPSVWLTPGASLRYYMPLFPCFACLIGIVMEGFITWPTRGQWTAFIHLYQRVLAATVFGAGGGILAISWIMPRSSLAQSTSFAVAYFLLCLAISVWIWWLSVLTTPRALMLNLCAVAGFLGLTHASLLVNIRERASENAPRAIAAVLQKVPAGQPLISLGPAHHLFLFHLQAPMRMLPASHKNPTDWPNTDYFGVWVHGEEIPDLNFPWEILAKISCDRNRSGKPIDVMIIGHRTSRSLMAHRAATN